MVFPVPSLNTYAGGDNDYINKFNNDNAALNNAFAGLVSDVNSLQTATGSATWDDWIRKGPAVEAWPDGVLGAYSLVLDTSDISSGNLKLTSTNASGVSVATMGGTRRYHIGTLTLALSSLSLTVSTDHDVYLGVTSDGDIGLATQASTTQGSVTLPLYKVPITVDGAGTGFTITTNSTPTRMPKTVYWDNTVEQLRQETPQLISIWLGDINQTTDGDLDPKIKIPFDHYLDAVNFQTVSALGATAISVTEAGNTVMSDTCTTETDKDLSFSAGYSADYAMAAGTVYTVSFNTSFSQMTGATMTFQVRRAYNAPLAN